MIEEDRLGIAGGRLWLVKYPYSEGSIELEYVNRQADPYYPDDVESIDIDKVKAIEIIAFLSKHFGVSKHYFGFTDT